MVEVGHDSLTIAEQRTHFNLWALSKSPLLIGTHVSPLPQLIQLPSISKKSLAILLNKQILAINQNPLSRAVAPFYPPPRLRPDETPQMSFSAPSTPSHWYGPLSTGETVVLVINMSDKPSNILLQWRNIPSLRHSTARMFRFRDVTSGKGWEGYSAVGVGVSDIPAHGNFVLIVSEEMRDGKGTDEDYVIFRSNEI
jgi:alpha-galactosidase